MMNFVDYRRGKLTKNEGGSSMKVKELSPAIFTVKDVKKILICFIYKIRLIVLF